MPWRQRLGRWERRTLVKAMGSKATVSVEELVLAHDVEGDIPESITRIDLIDGSPSPPRLLPLTLTGRAP